MRLKRSAIPALMGLAGMTLKRYPERGPYWYAVYRLKKPGESGRGKLCSLSTKETDCRKAQAIAPFLFMKSLAEYLGYALVPASPAIPQVPGWPNPATATPVQTPAKAFAPTVVPISSALDPEIEDVIALFYGEKTAADGRLLDCYMAEKSPGSPHPAEDTARTYRRRLRQLCEALGVTKHSELCAAYKGLTADRLRKLQIAAGAKPDDLITDNNFVPLVRGAAGVFSVGALAYYESHGIQIKTPFPTLPPLIVKHFEAPPPDFLKKLCADAEKELRNDPVTAKDYILFRLASRLGGRVQELTHLKWEDVTPTGVYIGPRKTKRGRFVKLRDHGAQDELLDYLETFRGRQDGYVISDGDCPIRRNSGQGEIKHRGMRIERRLVGWLREKISAAGLGEVNQCIHWLRKCVGTHIEQTQGALARAAVLGNNIASAAEADPGVRAAAAALGNSPVVAARHYIGKRQASA